MSIKCLPKSIQIRAQKKYDTKQTKNTEFPQTLSDDHQQSSDVIGAPFSKHPSVESTDIIDIHFDSTLRKEGQNNLRSYSNGIDSEENITPVQNAILGNKESVTTYQMRKDSDEGSFLVQMNESHQSVSIHAFEALDAQISQQTPRDYEVSMRQQNEISTQTAIQTKKNEVAP